MNKRILLVIIFALTVCMGGCNWLRRFTMGESMEILHRSAELTLTWDPPLTDIHNNSMKVASYKIYYRHHGTSTWTFLDEISASSHPEYTVEHDRIGDGVYDFGVRAVTISGQASALHSSLDNSADPISGWYVFWVNTE